MEISRVRGSILLLLFLLYPGPLFAESQIMLDNTVSDRFLSVSGQMFDEQDWLGSLRLDIVTNDFVILPESPCKGEGQLMKEGTLKGGC